MRYTFIEQERPNYAVGLLCRVMEVSRSGFYSWRGRPKSERAQQDDDLREKIKAAHAQSRGLYGAPRVHAELRDQEVRCGRKRVARLMRSAGLQGKRKGERRQKRRKSDSPKADNLLMGCAIVARPDAVWVSDITYLRTQEGWLYLAVVLDVFSRRVVAWAMQARMTTALTLAALEMACLRRKPPPSLIHHADRGGQYTGGDYRAALQTAGMLASTSGNCLENAVAESFFATLKTEAVQAQPYETRTQARRCVFDYLEVFYNRQRKHSSLGFQSPARFEESAAQRRLTDCLR